jgi:hypothetical protein
VDVDRLVGRLLLVATFVLACAMPATGDTFWQLRAGRDIWQHDAVPTVDRYSTIGWGRSWDDVGWGWQAVIEPIHRLGGMPLLTLGCALLAVAALVVVRRLAPSSIAGSVVLVLVVPLLATRWSLGPQLVTLLLVAVTLACLAGERLTALPVLFVLWANLDVGVAAGVGLLLLGAALALVSHLREHSPRTALRLRRMLLVTVLCGLLTVLNPLGPNIWRTLLSRSTGILAGPTALHLDAVSIATWTWLVAISALVVHRRARFADWATHVVLVAFAGTAVLGVVSVRNVGLLMLVTLPTATIALAPTTRPRRARVRRPAPVLAATVTLAALAVTALWVWPTDRQGWTPMGPVARSAVQDCRSPIYNTRAEGGVLIWFVPSVPVFVDDRAGVYPASFLRDEQRLEATGDHHDLFSTYAPHCAVVPPDSPVARALRRDGWSSRYADRGWTVLVPPHTTHGSAR